MKNNCSYCGVEFESKTNRAKYCSASCKMHTWRQNNPGRHKEHLRKYRDKTPKLCKGCGVNLSRETNHRYCAICAQKSWAESTKRSKQKRRNVFHSFKLSFGCHICGFAKFGSALDFHHFTGEKLCEINATNWKQTSVVNQEYDKCVLLCKNCHYGVHHGNITLENVKNVPKYKQRLLVEFIKEQDGYYTLR